MTIVTYLFTISAIGVFGMIVLKMRENRTKKRTFVSKTLSRFDFALTERFNRGQNFLDQRKERLNLFIKQDIPRHAKYNFFVFKKTAKEKYDSILPNIRGSRILRKNGDVSSFLREIAKHKKENGNGRIDDVSEEDRGR